MHCTKISAEFEFGGHSPPGWALPKCGVGLRVGKISAGCLVSKLFQGLIAALEYF